MEHHVAELQRRRVGNRADTRLVVRLLVRTVVDLTQTLQRNLGVLRGLHERDELRKRAVQLPEDILHGHHHTERHVALDNGAHGQKRHDDVLRLRDEQCPDLLRLAQSKALDADLEQTCLDAFPLPAFLTLARVELDVLHPADKLDHGALVLRRLLKTHVVQLAAVFHKQQHPQRVEDAAAEEHQQDRRAVTGHDARIDDEGQNGDGHAQQRPREERLHATVVADALQDVAALLRIEIGDRKPHELAQKIRDVGDADACGHVQRQPLPDQVVGELSECQGHLRNKDHHHEIQIARTDTHVDDGLRQKRQDQVQTAGHEHRKHQLYEVGLVGFEVLQQVAEFQLRVFLARRLVEARSGFQQQDHALFSRSAFVRLVVVDLRFEPPPQEFLLVVLQQSHSRIRNVDPPLAAAFADFIDDDVVFAVPVDDARQRNLVAEHLPRGADTRRAEAQRLGGIAQVKQRYSLA